MDADTYAILVAQQQILRGLLQGTDCTSSTLLLAQLDAIDQQLAEYRKLYDPLKGR